MEVDCSTASCCMHEVLHRRDAFPQGKERGYVNLDIRAQGELVSERKEDVRLTVFAVGEQQKFLRRRHLSGPRRPGIYAVQCYSIRDNESERYSQFSTEHWVRCYSPVVIEPPDDRTSGSWEIIYSWSLNWNDSVYTDIRPQRRACKTQHIQPARRRLNQSCVCAAHQASAALPPAARPNHATGNCVESPLRTLETSIIGHTGRESRVETPLSDPRWESTDGDQSG